MKILIVLSCALALSHAGFAPYYYTPLITPNGVPIDTPEVQLAKAEHFAAHAHARYGAAPLTVYHQLAPISSDGLPLDTPEVAAAKAQHHLDYAVAAHRNGVAAHAPWALVQPALPVVDTPEVQLAKAAHFAAHAQAAARNAHAHYRKRRSAALYPLHYPVLDHNGVPVEPAEVQAARANHLAEFAKVASRSGQHYVEPATYSTGLAYSHPAAYYRGPGGPPAQIGPDGQPIETHEVQAAKAAHFAAHAAVRAGQYAHFGHY